MSFFTREGTLSATERMTIDSLGKVGIGTNSPIHNFHLFNDNPGTNTYLSIESANSSNWDDTGLRIKTPQGEWVWYMDETANDDLPSGSFGLWDSTGGTNRMVFSNDGKVGIGVNSPTNPLEMASGAYVSAGGVWTNASSRKFKKDIETLPDHDALKAIQQLQPVKFKYNNGDTESYVGFIAEDVPDLVATDDRKSLSPMDIVAALTKVVQMQQQQLEQLSSEINALRQ